MSSENIATVIKMVESLPEKEQKQLIQHLQEYITDLENEIKWDSLVQKTEKNLVQAARKARQEIAEGKAKPMDYEKL